MIPAARGHLDKIRDDLNFYQHQVDGIRQMARMQNVLLADEMGLGKSIQALTVGAIDFQRDRARRIVIVCPATLKENWAGEMDTHTLYSYDILDGPADMRRTILNKFDRDVVVLNYELLSKHLDKILDMNFDIAIYDEAHYMKNRQATRSKACKSLRTPRSLLLTGSPMLNKADDLWMLLHKIDPSGFPNYHQFVSRYCLWGGYMDKQIIGVKNEKELAEKVDRVMVRRYKKDVLDLPEKQYIKQTVSLSPAQRKLYDQALDELQIDVPGDDPMEIENALVKFLRLKQICGTTACITGHPDDSMKLDRAVEIAKEIIAMGESVVVFTQFREVQRRFVERLADCGIYSFMLNGDVSSSQRVPIVNDWSTDTKAGKPSVLCSMIQVGGVGLTMTAASKCIFLDKLFSPKMNEQAEDRLHRIGASTTQPVQIYELICKDTIESRVEEILRAKTKVFGSIIDTNSSAWKRKLIAAVLGKDD